MHACLSLSRRCRWRVLLWIFLYAESSHNVPPFSLERGNLLTHEHDTTGMFNRCLSSLIIAGLKGVSTSFVDAHPSGIEPETLTLLSIIGTLHANFPQISQVRFLVDGQQRDTLAGHADLTHIYLASDAPGVKHL